MFSKIKYKKFSSEWKHVSFHLKDIYLSKGFPGSPVVINPAPNAGDKGSILPWGRSPGEENCKPSSISWETHGQGSLAGCNPWSCKELDMTQRLNNDYFSKVVDTVPRKPPIWRHVNIGFHGTRDKYSTLYIQRKKRKSNWIWMMRKLDFSAVIRRLDDRGAVFLIMRGHAFHANSQVWR